MFVVACSCICVCVGGMGDIFYTFSLFVSRPFVFLCVFAFMVLCVCESVCFYKIL